LGAKNEVDVEKLRRHVQIDASGEVCFQSLDGSARITVSPCLQWIRLGIPVRAEGDGVSPVCAGINGGNPSDAPYKFMQVSQHFHLSTLPARYDRLYNLVIDAMPYLSPSFSRGNDDHCQPSVPNALLSTFSIKLPTSMDAMFMDEGFSGLQKEPLSEVLCQAGSINSSTDAHYCFPKKSIAVEQVDGMVFYPIVQNELRCVEVISVGCDAFTSPRALLMLSPPTPPYI
jgi:hypothetical protein